MIIKIKKGEEKVEHTYRGKKKFTIFFGSLEFSYLVLVGIEEKEEEDWTVIHNRPKGEAVGGEEDWWTIPSVPKGRRSAFYVTWLNDRALFFLHSEKKKKKKKKKKS